MSLKSILKRPKVLFFISFISIGLPVTYYILSCTDLYNSSQDQVHFSVLEIVIYCLISPVCSIFEIWNRAKIDTVEGKRAKIKYRLWVLHLSVLSYVTTVIPVFAIAGLLLDH